MYRNHLSFSSVFLLQGFFRRCITQGMTHKCSNEEKCEITPFTRNSCQYCRLKKCFSVGMSREGKACAFHRLTDWILFLNWHNKPRYFSVFFSKLSWNKSKTRWCCFHGNSTHTLFFFLFSLFLIDHPQSWVPISDLLLCFFFKIKIFSVWRMIVQSSGVWVW